MSAHMHCTRLMIEWKLCAHTHTHDFKNRNIWKIGFKHEQNDERKTKTYENILNWHGMKRNIKLLAMIEIFWKQIKRRRKKLFYFLCLLLSFSFKFKSIEMLILLNVLIYLCKKVLRCMRGDYGGHFRIFDGKTTTKYKISSKTEATIFNHTMWFSVTLQRLISFQNIGIYWFLSI